ncbi:NAD(P)H-hydrate dehydratase [Anaeromicropila herbilytica]|uniref:Bifunctional NAD(P)H-hydrate repair enzyme n=1 Tax=Anaeromicropila herbilytica TaxID=2785025 RepID=A0A7R7END2_9FIRM|nr:NAD(P)H-hydrate dehydratase [Anaeromicropila herbilytica]BCN31934.1 bifunctional NAD(P)H-hydrate repair enzyme Nnr [Anaeromicropila herbilytica]
MRYILNNQEMKKLDYITITDIGIPSMVLMEKAALSVCEEITSRVKKSDKILIVAGIGNNGGDGIAIARLLYDKEYDVRIHILGKEENATEETKLQLRIAHNLGVPIDNIINVSEYNIVVDAIFGIGLTRDVTGHYEKAIRDINEARNTVFAVDIPSGIDGDTGKVRNIAVKADYTITFGYSKIGLMLYPGCEYAGEVKVADIGFATKALDDIRPHTFHYEKEDIRTYLPKRKSDSNKGSFGKVLVIAGSKNMSGACFLSAKAAYITGAGLVKVLTVEENRTIIQTLLPEALLTTYNTEDLLSASKKSMVLNTIENAMEWASVIVIGPGIGMSESSKIIVEKIIRDSKVPTILDADALNLLSSMSEYVKSEQVNGNELYQIQLPENFIITPHMKEMSRLLHVDMDQVREWYYDSTTKEKQVSDCIVVLKDARTLVVNKEKTYINVSGNNGMSTGGSGDVLTGIIAGLIAGGLENYEAAALGVFMHGMAADEKVKEKSTYSLMASDILDGLPHLFKV